MSLDAFAARFPGRTTDGLSAGVDVSGWQSPTIWATLPWARWAVIKVSEGTNFVEPSWPIHLATARAQGVACLPYHFARPDKGTVPETEAALFAAQVARAEWQGRAVLDLEAGAGNLDDWTLRFLAETHTLVGARIGGPRATMWDTQALYTARWFTNPPDGPRLTSPLLDKVGRWVAQYAPAGDADAPLLPSVWSDWDAWQWTSSVVQPNLDVNVLARPSRMLTVLTPLEDDLTPEQATQLQAIWEAVSDLRTAVTATGGSGRDSVAWRTLDTLEAVRALGPVQTATLEAVMRSGQVTVDMLRQALVAALRELAAPPALAEDLEPAALFDPSASTFDAATASMTAADIRYRNHGGQ